MNDFVNSFDSLDRVTVLGGEPLLHKDIDSIISNICNKGVSNFRITTNLIQFGAFHYKLHSNRSLTLCVSVDGHHAAVHDAIRGRGAFDKTISNIKLMLKAGYNIEITHTIMSSNINLFDKMIKLCKQLGVKQINLHRMSMHGNAINNSDLCVSPTEWVNFREQLLPRFIEKYKDMTEGLSIRYPILFVTQNQYEELLRTGEYHAHALGSYYGKGDRLILFADGRIYVSSEAFGTDAYIGTIEDGAFFFNSHLRNELIMFRKGDATISEMNPRQQGDSNYPSVLSVSFKRIVFA